MNDTPNTPPEPKVAAGPPKRPYEIVSVKPAATGFELNLDGRSARTPKRAPLALPTSALAEAIAAEWQAQGPKLDPRTMPLTGLANSAIDGAIGRESLVRDAISAYVLSDLLCYRAQGPRELIMQQAEQWDPLLAWAEQTLGLELKVGSGVMPVAQPHAASDVIHRTLERCDAFALVALNVMTALTGSCVLAFAVWHGRLAPEAAWETAHLDEAWQQSQWGTDEEAARRDARRGKEFLAAATFLRLAGEP